MDIRIEAFNLFNRVIWGRAEPGLQQQQLRPDHEPGATRRGRCRSA